MLVREWPQGRPRVLAADAWLANAGDGAIAVATERRLARMAPGAAVVHAAYQGDLLAGSYPELALVPPLAGLAGITPGIPEMRGWAPGDAKRLLSGADVVVSQGGGFALEHYEPLERLLAWEKVVERDIPLGFAAQTVGPFGDRRARSALRRVYAAAIVIAVRDPQSAAHVVDLGAPPEHVVLAADEAWTLFSPPPRAPDPHGLACVVSRHPQLRADGRLVVPEPDAIVDLLRAVVRAAGDEHVTLFSTQQGLGRLGRGLEDDGALAAGARARLPAAEAERVRLARGYLAPADVADLIADHRGLVSMRMHPVLIGLTLGVPSILASEAFKAAVMFDLLGLGNIVQPTAAGAVAALASGAHDDLSRVPRYVAAGDRAFERLLAAAAHRVAH